MSERSELVVVGAGLVGLATAREYLLRRPGTRLVVVDKEEQLAAHQSGRNSGVLHAGLYYAPGSLKARLCRAGRALLLSFADEWGIPYKLCGKVVVARDESEVERLDELQRRGVANGIGGMRRLTAAQLRELEPNVVGYEALHVPETGVIDFRAVAKALADDIERRGGAIKLGARVDEIRPGRGERIVRAGNAEFVTLRVAVCGGVQSDRLATLTSAHDGRYRIAPFRGDFLVLSGRSAELVNGLVYPVPDPKFPFLGVHFTRRIDGQVWAGPNAVPAFSREGYRRSAIRARDAASLLGFPGFWRLAGRYTRTGALEIWRALNKRAAVAEMRRYVPGISLDDVALGPCGIRAQVIDRSGSLIDEFVFEQHDREVLHVVNAPSPAATASLAIAGHIVDQLDASGE